MMCELVFTSQKPRNKVEKLLGQMIDEFPEIWHVHTKSNDDGTTKVYVSFSSIATLDNDKHRLIQWLEER